MSGFAGEPMTLSEVSRSALSKQEVIVTVEFGELAPGAVVKSVVLVRSPSLPVAVLAPQTSVAE